MSTKTNKENEIKITYYKNGNIRITPLKKLGIRNFIFALNDLDLDLFESNHDGWMYLISNSNNDVFYVNDYSYNNLNIILEGKSAIFKKVAKKHSECVNEWYEEATS